MALHVYRLTSCLLPLGKEAKHNLSTHIVLGHLAAMNPIARCSVSFFLRCAYMFPSLLTSIHRKFPHMFGRAPLCIRRRCPLYSPEVPPSVRPSSLLYSPEVPPSVRPSSPLSSPEVPPYARPSSPLYSPEVSPYVRQSLLSIWPNSPLYAPDVRANIRTCACECALACGKVGACVWRKVDFQIQYGIYTVHRVNHTSESL